MTAFRAIALLVVPLLTNAEIVERLEKNASITDWLTYVFRNSKPP